MYSDIVARLSISQKIVSTVSGGGGGDNNVSTLAISSLKSLDGLC